MTLHPIFSDKKLKFINNLPLDLEALKNIDHCKYFNLTTHPKELKKAYLEHFHDLPKSLFKYTKIRDSTFQDIVDELIYVSKPQQFKGNDDFDTLINTIIPGHIEDYPPGFNNYDVFNKDFLEEYGNVLIDIIIKEKNEEDSKKLINELYSKWDLGTIKEDEFFVATKTILRILSYLFISDCDYIRSHINIFCMTPYPLENKMWLNYADNYSGICIEYDFSDVDTSLENDIFALGTFPVQYDNKKYEVISNDYDRSMIFLLYFYSAMIKDTKYEDEKEWRYIHLVPIEEASFNQKIKFKPIKSIRYGENCLSEHIEKLRDICKKKNIKLIKVSNHLEEKEIL